MAAERFFRVDFTTCLKSDGTEVTDADVAVEEMIRGELLRHAPGDEVYGEETGTTQGTSGRRWVIDPIDGTVYFARRVPPFSTFISYEDEHGPAVGVICRPVARQIVFAGRGLGCWVGNVGEPGRQPHMRAKTDLKQVLTQLVNPATWHGELLTALHQNVPIAGGRVTDLSGGPVLSGPGTALISTGRLHDDLVRLAGDLPHDPRAPP